MSINLQVEKFIKEMQKHLVAALEGRHIESPECWCSPVLSFVADDGTEHWVHREFKQ